MSIRRTSTNTIFPALHRSSSRKRRRNSTCACRNLCLKPSRSALPRAAFPIRASFARPWRWPSPAPRNRDEHAIRVPDATRGPPVRQRRLEDPRDAQGHVQGDGGLSVERYLPFPAIKAECAPLFRPTRAPRTPENPPTYKARRLIPAWPNNVGWVERSETHQGFRKQPAIVRASRCSAHPTPALRREA